MSAPALSAQAREGIEAVLAGYVQVIDNADWDRAGEVFTPDARFGGGVDVPGAPLRETIDGFAAMLAARPVPLFPHQCTDAALTMVAPGVVRALSKFFTVARTAPSPAVTTWTRSCETPAERGGSRTARSRWATGPTATRSAPRGGRSQARTGVRRQGIERSVSGY
jgi:hypothetical protein